jgi:hypothetical protein
MRLRTKHASELDNPSRWNQYLKPWFDVEAFQQRINDWVGLARDGSPIIRLVWGQDVTTRAYFEETPKYWTRRQKGHPDFIWWTVPRWILEAKLEPEQYVDAWNATRYKMLDPSAGTGLKCGDCGMPGDPELINGQLYCRSCVSTNIIGGQVVDKGPPPEIYYSFMSECAEHEGMTDPVNGWPQCCTRAFYEDRRRCWGTYRNPGDLDLEIASQTVRRMEHTKARDPRRPLTIQELQEVELASNMQVERANEQFEMYERQLAEDFNKLHGWRLTQDSPPAFIDMHKAKVLEAAASEQQ